MATASVCGPCSRSDKTSTASKHCTDCDETLCSICVDVHSTFKAFQTHHLIPLDLVADHTFNIDKFCTKHAELPLELFCPDHDVLCCRACMTETHRSCEKLVPIEMASKGVKSSSMFDNISKRVVRLTESGHQFTDEMSNIESHLKQSKASALKNASDLRERLRKRIDKIYDESVSEINETYGRLVQRVEKNKKTVTEKVQNGKDIYEKFETVSKHGSESQIFLLMNLLKVDITNSEADLEKSALLLKTLTVCFAETDLPSLMRSLGSVEVQEQESHIKFKPSENQSAQISRSSHFELMTIQVQNKVSYSYDNNVWISGMCILDDDRLILCNNNSNRNLLVLSGDGQYISNVKLECDPWNIIIEPETGDAWVTMPTASYVQVVETKFMSLQRRVNAIKNAKAIAFIGVKFAVGTYAKIEIFSTQGIHVTTLKCGTEFIHSLCYKNDIIYCAEGNKNKLHGLRADGTILFTYASSDFDGPICIKSDSIGNVYVLCYKSKSLFKFTADGKLIDDMLDNRIVTETAYAAAFNKDYSKMFIVSHCERSVYICSCK